MEESVNTTFESPSSKSRKIFDYLERVKDTPLEEVLENGDASPETIYREHKSSDPIAGNTYSKNLVDRIPYIDSRRKAFQPTAGADVNFTGYIMPGNNPNRKIASGENNESFMSRLGNTSLADIHKAWNKYTVNPWVQSLMLGGIAGLGIYAAAPLAGKAVGKMVGESPMINRRTGEEEWVAPEDRRNAALYGGAALALANLARHVNWSKPSFRDITHFTKLNSADGGLRKVASMLGPVDYVPKSFAMNAVTMDPSIPDYLKYNTLNVLGNISGGGDTMINSTDMVSAGINSGLSGATGLPLGRIAVAATADALTAYGAGSLLGMNNPGTFARNVGIGSAAIRGLGSLL